MPVIIDSSAQIDGVRFRQASGDPAAPAASHWLLYTKAGGLYIEDSAAAITGPFGTGGGTDVPTLALSLTNASGAGVNQGDVVFISDGANLSFDTDANLGVLKNGANYPIGVVLDATIANAAAGKVAFAGYVPKVNLDASSNEGNYIYAKGSASQAGIGPYPTPGENGPMGGAFGITLNTGTTPPAFIWNPPVKPTEQLIVTKTGLDLNTGTAQLVFTVQNNTTRFMVTRVVMRNASTSLTTVQWSLGYNSTPYDDVVATAAHTELTGSTLYSVVAAKAGAVLGTATSALYFKCGTLQGGAATADLDIYGVIVH